MNAVEIESALSDEEIKDNPIDSIWIGGGKGGMKMSHDVPTSGVAAYITPLAKQHDVRYVTTPDDADRRGDHPTRRRRG